MKKIIFTLALLAAGISLYAYPAYSSDLKIHVRGHYDYSIRIGERILKSHYGEVQITGLHPGRRHFEVFRSYESRGYHTRERVYETIYEGVIFLKPGEVLIAEVNDMKRLRILERYKKHNPGGDHRLAGFDRLKNILRDTPYDNTKLKIASQFISDSGSSSRAVKAILREFTYESTKYKFALMAYRHVIDPENFFIVLEVFSYNSTKRRLLRKMQ